MATLQGTAAGHPGDATSCDATSPAPWAAGPCAPQNATPTGRARRLTFLVLQQGQGHGHVLGASDQGRTDRGAGHVDESRNEN